MPKEIKPINEFADPCPLSKNNDRDENNFDEDCKNKNNFFRC